MSIFVILSSVGPIAHAEAPKENVIIVFKNEIDHEAITKLNGKIEETFDNIAGVAGEVPETAIPALKKNKEVQSVEIDQQVKLTGQVQDWGINTIHAQAAWNSQITGKGVKVAVLDTGISLHTDLQISGGVAITSYTKFYTDDNGHGTHVAGIIGAKNNLIGTVGVAPDAKIYAVKVLDEEGSGYVSDIISGINWSVENKMDIINLSLGAAYDSYALHQAVDKAYNSGILVVAASGNYGTKDGMGDTVEYPARYDSTIAVSAVDSKNIRASFSATGNSIEVAAPGVNVLSTFLNNQYVKMSGTSMATPYVAGTLALLKEVNPEMSASQLREKLRDSSIDIGIQGKDIYYGYGLIQAPTIKENLTNQENTSSEMTTVPSPELPKEVVTKSKLSTSVLVNKTTYYAGNKVYIKLVALDQKTKQPIIKGKIKLTIDPPKGKTWSVTRHTNAKGEASYQLKVSSRSHKGTYKLTSTTTVDNYDTKSVSRTFKVK